MIPHHVFWCEVFDADDVILADNLHGELMLYIPTLVGDMLMQPGDLNPGFAPVPTALCFSGQLPLEPGQFLLFHPIGGNCEGLDSHIQSDNCPS